ncbi:hypothetical protein F9K88_12985 [Brucella intermedia]|uniref:Lipoprotein n=4 Tax=Brucella TaxID=234 RepID=U4VBS5_9HYPH|nr:hypothetical protein [Brucella intermedia]ERM00151.1 hypothetical protein Q644_06375 [Brucella intermedia 229E]KAB2668627.1 hypothetical protein F9K77_20210 [Ochrobactrum sp. LMG 5442]NKC28781.1 hypothetical protein [Brucella ciceri]PJT24977.1 hypothetical protein CN884_08730 [Ochrobactrum sp. 30A/1000/2015]PJT40427.1 hypothetical protein CN883_02715 [Ochrobactrum sp. 27A/999/2015]PJT42939.1 hypothetical protein CN882_13335 [Ochrobactrum sp. 23A/997/2015]HCH71144.1 hypothetical protein [O
MNRDIVTVGALLVVGVASCIGWSQNMAGKARLVSPPDQSQQPRRDETKIITIADGTRGEKRSVDTGSDGPSQGDLFVFDQPLMD